MSGDRNQTGDATASRPDGGNAPPADGGPQGQAGQGHAGQAAYAQGGGIDFERYAKLGGALYLILGIGIALQNFLNAALSSSSGSAGGGNAQLFSAVSTATGTVAQLAPLLALGLGIYLVGRVEAGESAPTVSAFTAGVGTAVTLLVLLVLQMVLAPQGIQVSLGDRIAPLIGIVVAIAAVAAAGSVVAEKLPDL
ncbi:hypothetical protein ACKVMT_16760 [Halobacteriales archaeon Cl-PHB]